MSGETIPRKIAENVILVLTSRLAMVSAIPLIVLYYNWQVDQFSSINLRIDQIEIRSTKQDSQIQDHESRMVFGKTARESFQADALKQFDKVNDRLDAVGARLTDLNGSIIELQTTIKERVPARSALRDTP